MVYGIDIGYEYNNSDNNVTTMLKYIHLDIKHNIEIIFTTSL